MEGEKSFTLQLSCFLPLTTHIYTQNHANSLGGKFRISRFSGKSTLITLFPAGLYTMATPLLPFHYSVSTLLKDKDTYQLYIVYLTENYNTKTYNNYNTDTIIIENYNIITYININYLIL